MATKLHLAVIQHVAGPEGGLTQTSLWSPQRTEFVWTTDFTAFRPVALKWWDDASYVAYELDAVDTGQAGYGEEYPPVTSERSAPARQDATVDFDDEIPF